VFKRRDLRVEFDLSRADMYFINNRWTLPTARFEISGIRTPKASGAAVVATLRPRLSISIIPQRNAARFGNVHIHVALTRATPPPAQSGCNP